MLLAAVAAAGQARRNNILAVVVARVVLERLLGWRFLPVAHIPLLSALAARLFLMEETRAATLYFQPSHQQVVEKAAAQLRVLLVLLAVRVVVQETMAHQERLALAQQIKVLRVAHQLARLEITLVPVVVAQVLRLQA